MARYQIILAYEGTHFFGFQRQAATRTVQLSVEQALRRLGWEGSAILYAGRTDAGVHAEGQVIAFDLDWRHSPEALGRAINANLPSDVAVRTVSEVSSDFHPRYDAKLRTYRYRIYCASERDPLQARFAWRVWPTVEEVLLRTAAGLVIGTHDFKAFGRSLWEKGSTTRTVYLASWQPSNNGLEFTITANAFLYHLVRRVVYLQVLVGQRRLTLEQLSAGVTMGSDLPPGLAPAQGLTLSNVRYS